MQIMLGPDVLINFFFFFFFLKIALYTLFGQLGFCSIFILSKNNDFQSEALLKMPPSSPSIEEFGLDVQN